MSRPVRIKKEINLVRLSPEPTEMTKKRPRNKQKLKFPCTKCQKVLTSQNHFQRHLKHHDLPQNNFICDYDGREFDKKDKLRLHIFQHRKYYRLKCDVCEKVYKTNQSMRKHLRSHFERHQCDSCGQVFRYKRLLQNHIAAIHNADEQSIQCKYCTRVFPTTTTRDAHMKAIHQDQKRNTEHFKCEICKIGFEMKEELRIHSFIHFEGEIHTCHECNQIFMKKRLLQNHMMKHEQASFECLTCHQFFKYRSNLGKHINKGRCKGPNPSLRQITPAVDDEADLAKSQLIALTKNPAKVEDFVRIKSEIEEHIKVKGEVEIVENVKVEMITVPAIVEVESKVELNKNLESQVNNSTAKFPSPKKVQKRSYEMKKPRKILKPASISYECDLCDFTTDKKCYVLSHMRRHISVKRNQCKECPLTFPTQVQLHHHSMKSHGHGIFGSLEYSKASAECSICHRKFSEQRIKKHMELHLMSRYECGKCGKILRDDQTSIENHATTCIAPNERRYTCTTCGKSFKKLRVLRQHEEIHNPIKIYVQCEICNTMLQIKSLKLHMEIKHGDRYKERNQVCECGKSFRYEKQLQKHIEMVHNKASRGIIYPCTECDMVFNRRYDLREHSFTHYDGKVFECLCGMRFKKRKLLTIHAAVHKEKRWPCDQCTMMFQTKGGRRKHFNRVHGPEAMEIPSYEPLVI